MVLIILLFCFMTDIFTVQHIISITFFLIECYENEFMCDNGFCILNYLICNNEDNCGDLSDENGPECNALRKL